MMPTPSQQLDVSSAIAQIRSAEQLLNTIIGSTGDPALLAQITAGYRYLNGILGELVQAQLAADDATFTQVTTSLKNEAAKLKAQEAQFQQIISNVALAAQIVGYIAQAVAFIAAI
jgi:hypothetical protein